MNSRLETPRLSLIATALLISMTLVMILFESGQSAPVLEVSISNAAGRSLVAEPIQPLPTHIELDPAKVALGEQLFHDPQLSHDNTIACSSCHDLALGGTDGSAQAVGLNGAIGIMNTPTVYNSGFNFRQFWNGRAASLEEQIDGPVHNPVEMGSSWTEIIARLNTSPEYTQAFHAIYDDGIVAANIKDAIAVFERSLYLPNSRFDQFLYGDTTALTADEQAGYRLFKTYGCASCHQGVNVGGNMYQRLGIVADYFTDEASTAEANLGRFNVTGHETDRHVFKVPSLRLAALTPPYFHDGSVPTLDAAIGIMGFYQLGRTLSVEEVDLIAQFLRTLPGEHVSLEVIP